MGQLSMKAIVFSLLLFNAGVLVCFMLMVSVRPSYLQKVSQLLYLRGSGSGNVSTVSASQSADRVLSLQRRFKDWHSQIGVDCRGLLEDNKTEQAKAQSLLKTSDMPRDFQLDERFAANDCQTIRLNYVTETLSQEEADFPIAFSLVVFKNFYQVEKLFKAVYRPEHFYCFHVDNKSSNEFYQSVVKYASCFPNVEVSEKRCDVQWGKFSLLEADLSCMKKLLTMSNRWRYFINLAGQEYPLRTMRELVRILKALNGSNNIENAGEHTRTPPMSVKLADGSKRQIKWYKGSVHITVTRGFVEYAFSDIGMQIIEHLRKHGGWPCPDETFFATLNNNAAVLKVPGADLTGMKTDNVKQPFLNRYKNWLFGVFGYPCLSGKAVRQICIWGIKDLPAMNKRPEFFVNKFYYNFQRFALQCMVERFWNNTFADYGVSGMQKTHEIPLHFYTKFEFVRNHL